jgi:uncharacterized protein involved in cysteine biosynthesis
VNPARELAHGFRYALVGVRLIGAAGIRRYVAIPLVINALIFYLAALYLVERLSGLAQRFLPDWLQWLFWPVVILSVMGIVFFGFTFLANLVATPFNGRLAMAVEKRLTGQPPADPASGTGLCRQALKAWLSELRKLAHAALCIIPVTILFLVPRGCKPSRRSCGSWSRPGSWHWNTQTIRWVIMASTCAPSGRSWPSSGLWRSASASRPCA